MILCTFAFYIQVSLLQEYKKCLRTNIFSTLYSNIWWNVWHIKGIATVSARLINCEKVLGSV